MARELSELFWSFEKKLDFLRLAGHGFVRSRLPATRFTGWLAGLCLTVAAGCFQGLKHPPPKKKKKENEKSDLFHLFVFPFFLFFLGSRPGNPTHGKIVFWTSGDVPPTTMNHLSTRNSIFDVSETMKHSFTDSVRLDKQSCLQMHAKCKIMSFRSGAFWALVPEGLRPPPNICIYVYMYI